MLTNYIYSITNYIKVLVFFNVFRCLIFIKKSLSKFFLPDYDNFDPEIQNQKINSTDYKLMLKTKSFQKFNFNFQKEKLNLFSHTYGDLAELIPPNSLSNFILQELINNKNKDIYNCCNPYCKKIIGNKPMFYAYDGYFCSLHCRHFVIQNMNFYWNKL